jgi:hypothetical protein
MEHQVYRRHVVSMVTSGVLVIGLYNKILGDTQRQLTLTFVIKRTLLHHKYFALWTFSVLLILYPI